MNKIPKELFVSTCFLVMFIGVVLMMVSLILLNTAEPDIVVFTGMEGFIIFVFSAVVLGIGPKKIRINVL